MATTPNYGWVTPAPTDFVTDLPADFETFADAVDADVYALDQAVVKKTLIDAKGDLLAGTASDTIARLAIGANGSVLTADSGETTGIKWATPSAAGRTLSQIATGTLSGSTVTLSSLSTYDVLFLQLHSITGNTGNFSPQLTLSGSTTGYILRGSEISQTPSIEAESTASRAALALNRGFQHLRTSNDNQYGILLENCSATGFTTFSATKYYLNSSSVKVKGELNGIHTVAAAVSSIEIINDQGHTFAGGTYTLWGG